MKRTDLALITGEIAAGVLVQASGVAGLTAALIAAAVVLATVAFIAYARRSPSLSRRVERFLAARRAAEPTNGDAQTIAAHDADTVTCYVALLADKVRRRAQHLRAAGVIGPNEEAMWSAPSTVAEIELIAHRLSKYEHSG